MKESIIIGLVNVAFVLVALAGAIGNRNRRTVEYMQDESSNGNEYRENDPGSFNFVEHEKYRSLTESSSDQGDGYTTTRTDEDRHY